MAIPVIYNFDLYNTTNYWLGYSIPNYDVELSVTQVHYGTYFSSNIIGSQIDFFNSLAGNTTNNPVFGEVTATLDDLPLLWVKYWWEEAMYYSHPVVRNNIFSLAPNYYQSFSECIGSLYFTSKTNNLSNTSTVPYNTIIDPLLVPGLSGTLASFYNTVNNLFVTNMANIGPGAGTDIAPDNKALIMADTDLTRRLESNTGLLEKVNELYPKIKNLLPVNTSFIGNQITPYSWSLSANVEDSTINVDFINTNINTTKQLTTSTLKAQ